MGKAAPDAVGEIESAAHELGLVLSTDEPKRLGGGMRKDSLLLTEWRITRHPLGLKADQRCRARGENRESKERTSAMAREDHVRVEPSMMPRAMLRK